MMRRSLLAVVTALFLAVAGLIAPQSAWAANPVPAGFSFPLGATSVSQGTFTGTLRIVSFGVQDGVLVASGLVTGTLVDETGAVVSIARTVTLPVASPAGSSAKALSCEVLHLELGPLDLDLLGLVVHLDRVVLDVSAMPGAGNLLGNLLCAVTNLLNGGGALAQIAGLLNQVLDILG